MRCPRKDVFALFTQGVSYLEGTFMRPFFYAQKKLKKKFGKSLYN